MPARHSARKNSRRQPYRTSDSARTRPIEAGSATRQITAAVCAPSRSSMPVDVAGLPAGRLASAAARRQCRCRPAEKAGGRERLLGRAGPGASACPLGRRTRDLAQSGRVRGRPNRGRMPGSKRVMALIWWPARLSTSRPFAWAIAAWGSRRYRPNAGCPLARVGIRRNLPPWKAHAKNRAASSRPWPRTGPPGLAPGRRALPAGRRGRARARPPYRRGWVRVARNQVRSSAGAG